MKKIIATLTFIASIGFGSEFEPLNIPDGATDLVYPPKRIEGSNFEVGRFNLKWKDTITTKETNLEDIDFTKGSYEGYYLKSNDGFKINFPSIKSFEKLQQENSDLKLKLSELEARIARLELLMESKK